MCLGISRCRWRCAQVALAWVPRKGHVNPTDHFARAWSQFGQLAARTSVDAPSPAIARRGSSSVAASSRRPPLDEDDEEEKEEEEGGAAAGGAERRSSKSTESRPVETSHPTARARSPLRPLPLPPPPLPPLPPPPPAAALPRALPGALPAVPSLAAEAPFSLLGKDDEDDASVAGSGPWSRRRSWKEEQARLRVRHVDTGRAKT